MPKNQNPQSSEGSLINGPDAVQDLNGSPVNSGTALTSSMLSALWLWDALSSVLFFASLFYLLGRLRSVPPISESSLRIRVFWQGSTLGVVLNRVLMFLVTVAFSFSAAIMLIEIDVRSITHAAACAAMIIFLYRIIRGPDLLVVSDTGITWGSHFDWNRISHLSIDSCGTGKHRTRLRFRLHNDEMRLYERVIELSSQDGRRIKDYLREIGRGDSLFVSTRTSLPHQ